MHSFTTEDVTQPKEGYEVYANKFWLCENGDPTKALFYRGIYPQCNKCRSIMKQSKAHGERYPDAPKPIEIIFIKTAFVKPLPQ
jgi:hypothetical protein